MERKVNDWSNNVKNTFKFNPILRTWEINISWKKKHLENKYQISQGIKKW